MGELGDGGSLYNRLTAVATTGLGSGVTAIAAGEDSSLAIQNGTVYSWGSDTYAALGNGTGQQQQTPVAIAG